MTRFDPARGFMVVAVALGILFGLGGFTFYYAEGFSYFSEDPQTCVNCHIMNDQFASWKKSGHHHVATCNDCHLPHDIPAKFIAKGRNGWNHSWAFTMQNFPEPIRITPMNAAILQANCVRCHGEFVHDAIIVPAGGTQEAALCVHCHRGVGHGR